MKEPKVGAEDPTVITHPRKAEKETSLKKESPDLGSVNILGWVGLAFLLVGGTDFFLTWIPTNFGNSEWEFATLTASLNGVPVPLLGLAAVLWTGRVKSQKWVAGLSFLCAVCFLLIIVVGMALWAMSIPLAIQSVSPAVATGLKKALLKTTVQGVVYSLTFIYLSLLAVRTMRGQE